MARAPSFTRFLDHTQRRITFGRTPLDEGSARRRDLYLTTHITTPCPRWDSNPQSQQASGRRPTPSTARRLGPALFLFKLYILECFHVCLLVPSTNLVNTLCALPLQSTDNAVLTDRCSRLSFNDVTYYLEFPVDLYLLCSVFLSVVLSQLP